MAGCQGRMPGLDILLRSDSFVWQHGGVPSRHEVSTALGSLPDLLDDLRDLIDDVAIWRPPCPPLSPVDRPEITILGRPLIPDANPMLLEEPRVRIALEEPEELDGDPLEEHPLGRDQREATSQIKA